MSVGVVVIGRNEGERLRLCLESVRPAAKAVVYADSGSDDGSVALAKAMNVSVLELDASRPFSAARARNEGFDYLLENYPGIRFVQFLDGDCVLAPGWLEAAGSVLSSADGYAAVIGHLRELHPDASPFNRLCAMEWKSPAGDLTDFGALGGISMMRVSAFSALGGFNGNVIAGEDSELGVRMALAGFKVTKIDHPMALHDANILKFSQWWKRTVRAGHAIGQRAYLNGNSVVRDCVRERNSVWFWGIGLPVFLSVTGVLTNGLSLVLLFGYPLLGARVYRYCQKRGDSRSDALLYAFFIILGKFAEAVGMIKFHLSRLRESYEIIEYK